MPKLKLVHVTTVPMSLFFLRGQPAFLSRIGFEVHAVSSPGPELLEFERIERVRAHSVPMERRITPFRDLLTVARLWAYFRAIRPTIVDAHTPKAGLLALLAARLAGVPVRIYHMHGLPFVTARGLRRLLLRTTERISCALASRVLCVSTSVMQTARSEGLCQPGKSKVVLGGSINGVDATAFTPAGDEGRRSARSKLNLPVDAPVVGFVGRIVRDKGIVELSEAWATLRSAFPHLRLLVLGPVEERDRPPTAVLDALASDPRVLMAGLDWDTAKYYRAMDVVALPTYREGFPVVPLEAAAMGLPVVATRVPGCIDAVVDAQTGTLVTPRDSAALAAAVRVYLEDPVLRHLHGLAARERILRDFDQQRIWAALASEYVELCAAQGISLPAR